MTILGTVIVILGLIILAVKLFLDHLGKEEIRVKILERTPFEVVKADATCMTIKTRLEFANEGKQVGTIMDCFVRPQLPYEQYDGIEAWGKAEREGAPREDSYFEAVLIEHQQSIFVNLLLTLRARKGMSLQEALASMVDFPTELIYEETGRRPWHYSKVSIEILAEELRKLYAGAKK